MTLTEPLRIGDWQLRLVCRSRRWRRAAAARFQGFTGNSPLRTQPSDENTQEIRSVEAEYRVVGAKPTADQLHRARAVPLSGHRQGQSLRLRGAGFEASIDLDEPRVVISGPLATYPLDLVLRAFMIEADDALVFHAAAVEHHGKAWLLTGPSGSGKSTFASLFPDRAVCDEMAAVRRRRDRLELVSLPFWNGRASVAPLEAVLYLRHGTSHQRRPLTHHEALERLRRQVLWPTWQADSVTHTLDQLADLIDSAPVHDLFFRPETSVWQQLEGAIS